MTRALDRMGMAVYSVLLSVASVLAAPWWIARMVGSGRYRAGLGGRLGQVPAALRSAASSRRVVWVHAVSVGEVLAATRLVAELEAALAAEQGVEWMVCVSTTTEAGQRLARERFGGERVFWYPLDFAFAVRAYLHALRPELLVLMESELWPRMLVECGRAGVPVAVVNARVSDRSAARGVRMRAVWGWVLRQVSLFLAQSAEDAQRLKAMGAAESSVRVVGNLKFDVRVPGESRVAQRVRELAAGRPIVVAGSTVALPGTPCEETMVIEAWKTRARGDRNALLVLAPRHPQRFAEVESLVTEFAYSKASGWRLDQEGNPPGALGGPGDARAGYVELVLLDTIGDLAAVYGVADVAFVGGSLVKRGGHNPLEPAQYAVPVLMGPSFENFREIVRTMQAADGIQIVQGTAELEAALIALLQDSDAARAMGERGQAVFAAQAGATGRTVSALLAWVRR